MMIEFPTPDAIDGVADWVELNVVYKAKAISKSELTNQIESASGNEPDEGFIGSIWQELKHREKSYSGSPFCVNDRTVKPNTKWQNVPEYIACLIFSIFGGTHDLFKTAKQFERISAEAIKSYLSCNVKILGWPLKDNVSFKQQVKNLADELKEEFVKYPNSHKKDNTVDIVAWKPFNDNRCNQLVILSQCASGKNWSIKKRVLIEKWREYIHWTCPPIPSFTIPQILDNSRWHDECLERGIMFDRIRIFNLIRKSKANKALQTDLIKWCKTQIGRLSN